MQLNRCPVCHTRISLDALAQDEAGRELLGILSKLDTDAGTALVGYLGLFRAVSRDLANDRALKLAREALGLGSLLMVAKAMRQTVESVQAKGGKPLTNHNYLKRVLEDVNVVPADETGLILPMPPAFGPKQGKTSKTAQALQALEDFGNG
jgi:hypothetical protein